MNREYTQAWPDEYEDRFIDAITDLAISPSQDTLAAFYKVHYDWYAINGGLMDFETFSDLFRRFEKSMGYGHLRFSEWLTLKERNPDHRFFQNAP